MAHDYQYGTRLESEGSPTALVPTYASYVRIPQETSGGLRAQTITEANRHGQRAHTRSFVAAHDFVLEVGLNRGSPETAADVYNNRDYVVQRFGETRERVWLTRNAPGQGDVEIPVVLLRHIQQRSGALRATTNIPLRALEFWRDQAVTHSAVNPVSGVTNNGNAPISDGSFVFSGMNGVQRLTNTTTGDWVEINTNTTVNAVTVDQSTGRVTQSGSDVDGVWSANDPWGIEVVPGANTFTLSGAGSVTFTGRDKWR